MKIWLLLLISINSFAQIATSKKTEVNTLRIRTLLNTDPTQFLTTDANGHVVLATSSGGETPNLDAVMAVGNTTQYSIVSSSHFGLVVNGESDNASKVTIGRTADDLSGEIGVFSGGNRMYFQDNTIKVTYNAGIDLYDLQLPNKSGTLATLDDITGGGGGGGGGGRFGIEDATTTQNRNVNMGGFSLNSESANHYDLQAGDWDAEYSEMYLSTSGGSFFTQSADRNNYGGLTMETVSGVNTSWRSSNGVNSGISIDETGTSFYTSFDQSGILVQNNKYYFISPEPQNPSGVSNAVEYQIQVAKANSITPLSSSDAYGFTGQVIWDEDYMYIKTSASGWKRVATTTF